MKYKIRIQRGNRKESDYKLHLARFLSQLGIVRIGMCWEDFGGRWWNVNMYTKDNNAGS